MSDLYFMAYDAGVAGMTLEEATEDIVASFGGRHGELWLGASPVIEAADGLVRAVLTVRRAPWNDTPDCPFIIEVFTAREHRRRGLASAALANCLATLHAAGEEAVALRVDDDNIAAQALYASLEFQPWDG